MRQQVAGDEQQLAERVASTMFARDTASQSLGMQVKEVRPGCARITLVVRPDMLNSHAICHGGIIFTLADSAFAFACNSRNQNTVASGCSIDFLAPAKVDDQLTAEAVERALLGRIGVYDVTVTNQEGRTIALFRGRSYRVTGEVIPPT
ncbi:MAG TPA: hydroxyphenylacetyl-CoA thioesterase PaaI [Chthoniobacterales bacterium]|jgi:acyl-CoA thioesterase|nr:hydroxyphenylacetyl-CoA thioesterase PaaI [Chthoniobacterales bacterium]